MRLAGATLGGGSLASVVALLACFGCSRSGDGAPFESRLFSRGEPPRELNRSTLIFTNDELFLTLETQRALHVYVINDDGHGNRRILYPCVIIQSSWIEAGRHRRLPPMLFDRETFWPVRAPTVRERILVVASAVPLDDFEKAVVAAQDAEPCAVPPTVEAEALIDRLATLNDSKPSATGVVPLQIGSQLAWLAVHEVRGEPG